MSLRSQRTWLSATLFASAVLVGSTICLWNLAAAGDGDAPSNNAEPKPVPAVEPSDEEKAEKPADVKELPFAVPQPKPQPAIPPKKTEDLEAKLEVVFEKPFRPVRGKEGRFDVTVRVQNKTEEPVEGPVYLQIVGSTYENLVVLDVPMVANNGDPLFEVIAEEASLSHRSRRGKVFKLTFESRPSAEENEQADQKPAVRSTGLVPAPVEDEIDWRLTREGMKLAEPMKFAEVRSGRGRGSKNRGLPIPSDDPVLAEGSDALDKAAPDLLKIPGVEGFATSLDAGNNLVQLVFVKRLSVRDKLPKEIGGLPVKMELTWGFKAYQTNNNDPNNRGQGGQPTFVPPPGTCPNLPFCSSRNLQDRFPLVFPIGAQINNQNELQSVGTYGFLATDGTTQFIGSNNHVIGRNNRAQPGEVINQNFRAANNANQVATLTRLVNITFRSLANGGANTVDGAIAAVAGPRSPTFVTPCFGYGAMTERVVTPTLGDTVRKCGRTTACTTGTITSVNARTNVRFTPTQTAGFVDQITIVGVSGSNFSSPGDSGSGIVTATGNNPVGLLFAGSGNTTSANKMQNVVSALGVTIVGQPAGCPVTPLPPPPGVPVP